MKVLPLKQLLTVFFLCIVSISFSQQLINQRQIVLLEKARRSTDPWPRGDGHMLIAEPGSPVSQKGYHEPGGSFSPSPGSFGLAFWIYDNSQQLVGTSDNVPLDKIKQAYVYNNGSVIPSVETITPYYKCTWSYLAPGRWELSVSDITSSNPVKLVSRSVGPAGGPVTSALWDSTRLMINNRWILTPSVTPSSVMIGDEEKNELMKTDLGTKPVYSANGWAFASLAINQSSFSITVTDTKPQFNSQLSYDKTMQQFSVDMPDKRFEKSLEAQVANLMMGYVGRQTGPGEPINYPLAWERDGAYSLMAIGKSGNLQTARELSVYFAENDFFGGFGAEGDAPGSEINALSEIAFLLNDADYYKWVWPHIKRKLVYIDEMMNAKTNIYKNFIGPLAPHIQDNVQRRQWICKPTEDGLIVGAMDNHFPVLYINAISYRGLIQASRMAIKMNEPELAKQCIEKAAKIKEAWTAGFGKKKYDNERNFMISVWPSWITNKENSFYKEKIEEKHQQEWNSEDALKERPLWTYFTVAEAHQWLFLDRPDRVWKVINYFWNNQCSPGLYTYWEGNGEENTFRQWENYRGWLQPKYVTPHYWTASEMAHLQMDMLVYIDESQKDFQLVIGAGIPADWLNQNMSVKNFRTKAGLVSWEYKNNVLNVTVKGGASKWVVKSGTSFAQAKAKLAVSYK